MSIEGINKVIQLVRESTRFRLWDDEICIGGLCQISLAWSAYTIAEAFQIVSGITDGYIALRVVYPGIYADLPDGLMIYRSTAIRMLEILRDEGVVDWVQASEDTAHEPNTNSVLV